MRADLITPPQNTALAELISVDPLGYECIREDDIDLAFFATGKGVRLPRTCLPDPCDAALTREHLGGLIGRAPTEPEWDDYFSRYADYCRKEVVPFTEDPVAVAGVFEDAVGFWAPLAASYPANAPIRAALPGRGPSGLLFGPISSSSGSDPVYVGERPSNEPPDPDDPNSPDDPDWLPPLETPDPEPEDPLSSAPIPATWLLFLTGAACLMMRRRRDAA